MEGVCRTKSTDDTSSNSAPQSRDSPQEKQESHNSCQGRVGGDGIPARAVQRRWSFPPCFLSMLQNHFLEKVCEKKCWKGKGWGQHGGDWAQGRAYSSEFSAQRYKSTSPWRLWCPLSHPHRGQDPKSQNVDWLLSLTITHVITYISEI